MENAILEKLEEEKNKYVKKLNKNFESLSSYINDKYVSKNAIFYENIINHLILYKLMKNYSAVPDMIINFIEKKIYLIYRIVHLIYIINIQKYHMKILKKIKINIVIY